MSATLPDWVLPFMAVQFVAAVGWAINQKIIIERLRGDVRELQRDQAKSDSLMAAMGSKIDAVVLGNARIEEQVKTLFDMVKGLSK